MGHKVRLSREERRRQQLDIERAKRKQHYRENDNWAKVQQQRHSANIARVSGKLSPLLGKMPGVELRGDTIVYKEFEVHYFPNGDCTAINVRSYGESAQIPLDGRFADRFLEFVDSAKYERERTHLRPLGPMTSEDHRSSHEGWYVSFGG